MNKRKFTDEEITKSLESNKGKANQYLNDIDAFEKFVQELEESLEKFPAIGQYASDIMCLVSLARRYIKKEYTDISVGNVMLIICALIYVVSPLDLVPDTIPVVGVIDDIAVIKWVLGRIHDETEKYKKWRIDNHIAI